MKPSPLALFGAVISVAALAVAFVAYNKIGELKTEAEKLKSEADKQSAARKKRLNILGSGDDQPITVSGGSLLLGNDPTADWETTPTQLVYNSYSNQKLRAGLLEVISADGPKKEQYIKRTRVPNTPLVIMIDVGLQPKKGHYVTIATDDQGDNLALTMIDAETNVALSPGNFMRIIPSLRRHPKKKWEIQAVVIKGTTPDGTGTATDISLSPAGSDFSLVLHYSCSTGNC